MNKYICVTLQPQLLTITSSHITEDVIKGAVSVIFTHLMLLNAHTDKLFTLM